jgi:hypothetical protein
LTKEENAHKNNMKGCLLDGKTEKTLKAHGGNEGESKGMATLSI